MLESEVELMEERIEDEYSMEENSEPEVELTEEGKPVLEPEVEEPTEDE